MNSNPESVERRLMEFVTKSAFYLSPNYTINTRFQDVLTKNRGLLSYNDEVNESLSTSEPISRHQIIAKLTPQFQRDNKKWDQEKQIGFIENLLCGCATTIQLYCVNDSDVEFDNAMILDGLQRLTAIASFLEGEFPVFDDIWWKDIKHSSIMKLKMSLSVHIYQFDSHLSACRFYIQFNKGVTHSESDLKTAYDFIEENS